MKVTIEITIEGQSVSLHEIECEKEALQKIMAAITNACLSPLATDGDHLEVLRQMRKKGRI